LRDRVSFTFRPDLVTLSIIRTVAKDLLEGLLQPAMLQVFLVDDKFLTSSAGRTCTHYNYDGLGGICGFNLWNQQWTL
jgi:hypothetical protein